ncbi:DUF2845 domain-containing protein [Pseudomonas lalucatii]|uniref:DUF2845 domain-containing protein n=1 Tax=Pseudomonas lalucatii TaxID=1424203 RepID=A0ABS5PZU9_9PSED|nr:DUF2845 domain-containing protein [Pseudomonas lalucatii]MBS7662017.1 DUF2845 domain-containing protein [Pseudomonas lalucatii]MBS7690513.1 DUF2845 domain-containing protein [Pseudomonas lalucatii]MBS7726154.1 DUF2845 domain-containing protein [Pseudomonas lalucatii]QVM88269.1 DUF2845 domain-containing protein [Pseudomonas lalucatii]
MRRTSLSIVLLLSVTCAQASLRCEHGLASKGDRTSEVQAKCGQAASRELVGYTENAAGDRELPIEEWVYGPRNGMYYYLTFQGGRLQRIDSQRGN